MNGHIKDLTNKKFNYFKVISFVGTHKNRSQWKCLCKCGIIKIIDSANIGKTQSCGCLKNLTSQQAVINAIYRDYQFRAKKKNLKFELTKKQFSKMILTVCFYCNSPPKNLKRVKKHKLVYNGIDRVNSTKGYTLSNTRTCCSICNTMKMNYTEKVFKTHIQKLHKIYLKKVK